MDLWIFADSFLEIWGKKVFPLKKLCFPESDIDKEKGRPYLLLVSDR